MKPFILNLSWDDVSQRAGVVADEIISNLFDPRWKTAWLQIFGIPRGGIHVATLIAHHLQMKTVGQGCPVQLVTDIHNANIIVDDILDSGATAARYQVRHAQFFPLYRKRDLEREYNNPRTGPRDTIVPTHSDTPTDPARPNLDPSLALEKGQARRLWISFPWERMQNESGPEDAILRILQYIGEDVQREGLKETPSRVIRSWEKLYGGYKQDPQSILKTFTDGACNEMVVLQNVEFYSTCEHHMLPFFGRADIGYIPNGKLLGISKLARLLEVFARRLQIQERLGQQITETLERVLHPKGCGCVLRAQHFCMTSRGVEKQKSVLVTSSLRGSFLEPAVRAEFLKMIGD